MDKPGPDDIIVFEESLQVPYRYSAGPVVSRFFRHIRDHKQITANRCGKCAHTFVPPRSVCPVCFSKIQEWVDLPGTGKVDTYTTVRYAEPIHPRPFPLCYGLIRLDGASHGALLHILAEVEPEKIYQGMEVTPVFAEERKGTILDILYFRPKRKD